MRVSYPLSLLFVSLTLAGNAQQGVLTANEFLPAGSSYSQRSIQNLSAIDTTSGTNVVWNFTDLVPTGSTETVSILAPAGTPNGNLFPTANYCVYESVIPRHGYFNLNSDSMSRVGFYTNQAGIYTDPQTELVFPVQYGSANTDDWENTAFSFPGTYRYTVIGTGSLQLPGVTHNDVLLLRVVNNNLIDFRQYAWISATNGVYLVLYNLESLFGPASGLMTTTTNVGLAEASETLGLRIHAPSDGLLPVTYTAATNVRYHICDATGRLLVEGSLPATAAARSEWLPAHTLKPGIHLLQLMSDTDRHAVRFLME